MELKHIPLEQLHVAAINMRHDRKPPDISDILPSVRARGILQPLLVRPNADGYEIVAGRRRYFSAKQATEEQCGIGLIPCAVMEPGDDAAALEARGDTATDAATLATFNRTIPELRFDGVPFGDVIDFLRDVTGAARISCRGLPGV